MHTRRKGASAGAHLQSRRGRAGGLVGGILSRFDGIEDVFIGGGGIHRTAHQLVPTGVPLDPGRESG